MIWSFALSEQIAAVEVVPGYREIEVYYSWDHGSQRGLAPALVDYAAAQTGVSRVLRFTALPGEVYTVHAEPTFLGERQDITTLAAVDFGLRTPLGRPWCLLSRRESNRCSNFTRVL